MYVCEPPPLRLQLCSPGAATATPPLQVTPHSAATYQNRREDLRVDCSEFAGRSRVLGGATRTRRIRISGQQRMCAQSQAHRATMRWSGAAAGRRVGVLAPACGDVARAARHTRGTAPAWCRLPVARRLRGSMQALCAAWHSGNGDLVSHSARAPHKPDTHADTCQGKGAAAEGRDAAHATGGSYVLAVLQPLACFEQRGGYTAC